MLNVANIGPIVSMVLVVNFSIQPPNASKYIRAKHWDLYLLLIYISILATFHIVDLVTSVYTFIQYANLIHSAQEMIAHFSTV